MILVEFASSGYSKGASLNAGVSFLWESTESLNEMLSYDYECQVITSYVEYKNDDEAFQNGIEKLAKKALEKEGMSYILEVKRHSPSKGQIVSTFDFKAIAKEYEMIGADAISVVTEPDFFKGDDDFLREIKRIVKIPVLRKDFVVDEYMVYEA